MSSVIILVSGIFCILVGLVIFHKPIEVKSVEEFISMAKEKRCKKINVSLIETDLLSSGTDFGGEWNNSKHWLRFVAKKFLGRNVLFDFYLFSGDWGSTVSSFLLAEREFKRIKTVFPGVKVSLIKGKGDPWQKEEIEEIHQKERNFKIKIRKECLKTEDCVEAEKRFLKDGPVQNFSFSSFLNENFVWSVTFVLLILFGGFVTYLSLHADRSAYDERLMIVKEKGLVSLVEESESSPELFGPALILGGPMGVALIAASSSSSVVLLFKTESGREFVIDKPNEIVKYSSFVGKPIMITYTRECKNNCKYIFKDVTLIN